MILAALISKGMPVDFLRDQSIVLRFAMTGIFILAATVACSSGDDAVAPATEQSAVVELPETSIVIDQESVPTTDAEVAYLEGLDRILETRNAIRDKINELFGGNFPTFAPDNVQAFVLLNALREAKFGERTADALSQLQALDPPERLALDHAEYLANRQAVADLGARIDDAVEKKDLPLTHLLTMQVEASNHLIAFDISSEYCNRILNRFTVAGGVPRDHYCGSPDLPGGEYGASVYRIVQTWSVQFLPLAGLGTPGMSNDDLITATSYIQPPIIDLFEEVTSELAKLEPPAELSEGHEVLAQFFDESLATSKAIDKTVAAHDYDAMQREFARSREITRALRDRMPPNYQPLIPSLYF